MPLGSRPPSGAPDPMNRPLASETDQSLESTTDRTPLEDRQRTLLQLIAAAPNATATRTTARTGTGSSSHLNRLRDGVETPLEHPFLERASPVQERESYVRAERNPATAESSEQESDDDLMLASSSLQAGTVARTRRLSSMTSRLNPYRITEEDRNALLEAALAGDDADGPDTAAAAAERGDQLVGDTGWLRLAGRLETETSPEVSPEERRAMRRILLAGTDWQSDDPAAAERNSSDGEEDQALHRPDAFADDFTWAEREMPSIWRNDPLSVPRLSALPRGGRNVRLTTTSGASMLSESPSRGTTQQESSDPVARSISEHADDAPRPFRSGGIDLRTPRVPRDYANGMNTSEIAQSLFDNPNMNPALRAFLRGPPAESGSTSFPNTQPPVTGTVNEDAAAAAASTQPGPSRLIDHSTSRVPREHTRGPNLRTYFQMLQQGLPEPLRSTMRFPPMASPGPQPIETASDTESESETDQYAIDQMMARLRSPGPEHPPGQSPVAQRSSTTTRTTRSFFERSGRDEADANEAGRLFFQAFDYDTDSDTAPGPDADQSRPFGHASRASPRRRTREETHALMGATLRSKKSVWLLYCGSDGAIGDDPLPAGFSHASTRASDPQDVPSVAFSSGCGALVCSRALLDGVPNKVFSDGRDVAEQPAASSDLPPRADRVADLEGEGAGERVGARGWKKCKGCVTRDIACTRCGNILGYRLLRPCVGCSISRPTYTTYASAVTNDPRSPNGSLRPVLSAGGVTGGGVVDGLLFHFRRAAVTPVPRLVGIAPADELCPETAALRTLLAENEYAEDEDEIPRQGPRGPSAASRLREKAPQVGDKMMWKHIPSPQRDFEAGLVGEPSDWISPSSETWWLDHAIVKHSRKRSAGAAFADSSNSNFNPDSLSSARTTASPSGMSSITPLTGSPLRSSLSRSHAIRVRVPIANAHPASSISAESPADSYDRFRHDASDFARRVRQRHGDPSASDSAVVTSLARAGYGSGFTTEAHEEGPGAASGREVVGR